MTSFQVAKEILEKFAPESLPKPATTKSTSLTSPSKQPRSTPMVVNAAASNTELRKRLNAQPRTTPFNAGGVALTKTAPTPNPQLNTTSKPLTPATRTTPEIRRYNSNDSLNVAPGPPLPRPVLARDRGYMDRVVEYLVGDGPSNRYALICKQCQSHNGMALKEEFEFVSYRCCYCHYWNPARKQRPTAPKLDLTPMNAKRRLDMAAESEETTSTSEDEAKDSKAEADSKAEPKAVEESKKAAESSSSEYEVVAKAEGEDKRDE